MPHMRARMLLKALSLFMSITMGKFRINAELRIF